MQLNYKSFGTGPALIILHGLFGSLDNWQTLARQFAEDFSVFIIDQRNHGKSPHTEEHSYELMAEDLLEFLDQHGIYQANLLGHSMGGKTVMQFAVNNEERIEKMVVADMGIRENEVGHAAILDALQRFPMDKISSRNEADEILQKDIKDWGIRQFLLKNIERTRDKRFKWKFNLDTLARDYKQILAALNSDHSIDVPTLFLRGGKSDYVRDKDWGEIQEMFPEAELATIPDVGHWLHAEAPKEFYGIVKEWLLK